MFTHKEDASDVDGSKERSRRFFCVSGCDASPLLEVEEGIVYGGVARLS